MKTEVVIGFRPTADEVKSSLPAALCSLSRSIRKSKFPLLDGATAHCPIDPRDLDLLIEWGREWVDGKSRIRLIQINEKYELADFETLPAVELVASDELDDTCFIRNFKSAFRAEWDCSSCKRARWTQVGDLQVRPYGRVDCQQTMTHDWLLSSRAREALGEGAFTFRELLGGSSWQQLSVTEQFHLHMDGSSLRLRELCTGCGQPVIIFQNDLVEGSYMSPPEISIARDLPLTVTLPETPGWTIAISDLVFGNFELLPPGARHPVGEAIKLEQMHFCGMYPKRAMVVSIETARRLTEHRISGIAFRPVRIAS